MNAAGLTFVLHGVIGMLGTPFFDSLVTEGSISPGELALTRNNLSAVLAILKDTPHDKIEAMVGQFDGRLTEQLDEFNAAGAKDTLSAFRSAQYMAGHITTVMAKSGLRS
jgi:hypothetical protein